MGSMAEGPLSSIEGGGAGKVFARTAIAATAGGISAELGGGKFANGALSAAFVHLFNGEARKDLRTSISGYKIIMEHEGFMPMIYEDQAGYATIGYGHKLNPGEADLYKNGITKEQALALLKQDVAKAELAVNQLVFVPLSQSQFDALVSFTFNVGRTNFANSTLLKLLNNGNYVGAAEQLLRWNIVTVDGQKIVSKGLVNRRFSERCLFIGCQ